MPLIDRLLRWTTLPTGRRAFALLCSVLLLVLACNPDLLPLLSLLSLIDALGMDVVVLLLAAQVTVVLPWLRERTGRWFRLAMRIAAGVLAGVIGGYLRQLVMLVLIRSGTCCAIYRA
ncbi:TPA: hypothetical protein ACOENG_002376 [Stenotrophomonas maltophilia]|uniref:Transmembrane protein n=1 Tax=Stenotrophomonas maltophilia TaxID=40324 RepID=A0AAI9CLD7_STEMA|nr:hypothetical protein [Stenotrophomonas maltophilia]EJP77736.1 hypothetical protein A1OC_01177 [Stenotrophomonas maltophilia Ab55555]EKT2104542.1 hypothetical protein [Stenotrophomonas maltophilia]EKZ1927393.1 hypothetical protein [Stenotrophomonas maltophilia]ELE7122893.1 hypothetical protein [Stenotrophomonas maltophilia]EMB2746669.1 hypothetical protein [Stenotrophomonas maltophilia]